MIKKVIYTSIVGNYDTLREPLYIAKDWDYICYSNEKIDVSNSVWELRPIPIKHKCKTRLSRFVKLNPHLVLKEYDYSIWIDANFIIKTEYITNRAHELIKENHILAIPPHGQRECIYDEAEACIRLKKDKKEIINKQVEFLKKEGYPQNNGLYANGLIFRRHNNSKIKQLCDQWWYLLENYSKRDQIGFVYLIWKYKVPIELFMTEGYPFKNSKEFEFIPHNKKLKKRKIKKMVKTWILLFRDVAKSIGRIHS